MFLPHCLLVGTESGETKPSQGLELPPYLIYSDTLSHSSYLFGICLVSCLTVNTILIDGFWWPYGIFRLTLCCQYCHSLVHSEFLILTILHILAFSSLNVVISRFPVNIWNITVFTASAGVRSPGGCVCLGKESTGYWAWARLPLQTSGHGQRLTALCTVCTHAHCLVRSPDTELPAPQPWVSLYSAPSSPSLPLLNAISWFPNPDPRDCAPLPSLPSLFWVPGSRRRIFIDWHAINLGSNIDGLREQREWVHRHSKLEISCLSAGCDRCPSHPLPLQSRLYQAERSFHHPAPASSPVTLGRTRFPGYNNKRDRQQNENYTLN